MTELVLEDYSEKAIVVRGDTKTHKDALTKLGGKWNAGLRGGGGWIFPKKKEADVAKYVNNPDSSPKTTKATSLPSLPTSGATSDLAKEVAKLSKKISKMNDLYEKLIKHLIPEDDEDEEDDDEEEVEEKLEVVLEEEEEEEEEEVVKEEKKPRKRLLK